MSSESASDLVNFFRNSFERHPSDVGRSYIIPDLEKTPSTWVTAPFPSPINPNLPDYESMGRPRLLRRPPRINYISPLNKE